MIDAHLHFWRYTPAEFGWVPGGSDLAQDRLPDDARPLLDAAGIAGGIAVQARSTEAETAFLLELARTHPWIMGVVGWLDLTAPDLAARIAHHRATGPLVGLRHIAQDEPDDFLTRPAIIDGARAVLAARLSYDVLIYARQLDAAAVFVDAVGEGRLILDHGGKPDIARGEWQPWADGIARLARHPHLWCKISGLATEADHATWHAADIAPYLDHLLACFGPERLIYASDWPVCTLAGDYSRIHALARDFIRRACPDHEAAILGDNARRAYGLG